MTQPTFFVIELNVKDPEKFNSGYGSLVGPLVSKHHGTFIVTGQKARVVEGSPPNGVVIIVRFDSAADAQALLSDPDYVAIAPVRRKTAETRSYLVDSAI